MSIIYTTKDGDILDAICFKYYGESKGSTEKVIEANRHLANESEIFEAGVKVILPQINQNEKSEVIKLWS